MWRELSHGVGRVAEISSLSSGSWSADPKAGDRQTQVTGQSLTFAI